MDPGKVKSMKVRFVAGPLMVLGVVALVWADFRLDGGRGRISASFVGLLALVGLWEYVTLLERSGRPVASLWVLGAALGLHVSAVVLTPSWKVLDRELYAPVLLAMALLVPLSARALTREGMEKGLETAGSTLVGFLLVSWPLYFAQGLCLRFLPWMIWLTLTAKSGDTGAYLVGVFFGRHKLIPHVSPGKSVEGALGGLAASVAVGMAASGLIPADVVELPLPAWAGLGIMVGMTAQISDLVESMVKRLCGAKDSSRLVPVHGGVLDLVDSFLLSTPPFFLLVVLLTGGSGA